MVTFPRRVWRERAAAEAAERAVENPRAGIEGGANMAASAIRIEVGASCIQCYADQLSSLAGQNSLGPRI